MNENIKALIKKVMSDKELQALRDPDEAYKFASSVQSGFTKEEFFAAMTEMKNLPGTVQKLTDEDLDKAAGGWLTSTTSWKKFATGH